MVSAFSVGRHYNSVLFSFEYFFFYHGSKKTKKKKPSLLIDELGHAYVVISRVSNKGRGAIYLNRNLKSSPVLCLQVRTAI